ncbi:four helix bundle protein [Patescibacteria group bacterium]|nr:four helix bundle protein [Patescibacteria group bacterium]
MKYSEHQSYKIGFELSNIVWKIVKGWYRYYKKDKIVFFNYAKASFYESVDWINKAIQRGLIKKTEADRLRTLIIKFPKEINGLIKGTRINLKK